MLTAARTAVRHRRGRRRRTRASMQHGGSRQQTPSRYAHLPKARILRLIAAASLARCSRMGVTKRGGRSLCRPFGLERRTYFRLVIAVRSAESLTMPAAPHQPEPKRPGLMRGDVDGRAGTGGVIAGEGVAIALRQVGVGVTKIQREHLVGEADADVPGVVVGYLMPNGNGCANGWRCRRTSPKFRATGGRTHRRCTCRGRLSRRSSSAP